LKIVGRAGRNVAFEEENFGGTPAHEHGDTIPQFACRQNKAVFRRVLVDAHAHVEGRLDGRDRAFDLQIHAIAGTANHPKAVRCRVGGHGVIVFLGGTKPVRELRHRKEVPVGRA